MNTILEIAREAAERALVAAPPKLFGANNRNARILRVAANDGLRDLMRAFGSKMMDDLHAQWVFKLQPGVFRYDLPPDYHSMIPGAETRQGWPMGLIGPVTPQTFAKWLAGYSIGTSPFGWRIRNGMIQVEPTPAAEETIVIDYISKYRVLVKAGDVEFEGSGLTPSNSGPYVPRDGHIVVDDFGTDAAKWGSAMWGSAVWGYPGGVTEDIANIFKRDHLPFGFGPVLGSQVLYRRNRFERDTDIPVIRDTHLLSLYMTYRLEKGLKIPFADSQMNYELEKSSVLGNAGGGARDIPLGHDACEDEVFPLGDGNWMLS